VDAITALASWPNSIDEIAPSGRIRGTMIPAEIAEGFAKTGRYWSTRGPTSDASDLDQLAGLLAGWSLRSHYILRVTARRPK
jgi:hypothetical protein